MERNFNLWPGWSLLASASDSFFFLPGTIFFHCSFVAWAWLQRALFTEVSATKSWNGISKGFKAVALEWLQVNSCTQWTVSIIVCFFSLTFLFLLSLWLNFTKCKSIKRGPGWNEHRRKKASVTRQVEKQAFSRTGRVVTTIKCGNKVFIDISNQKTKNFNNH